MQKSWWGIIIIGLGIIASVFLIIKNSSTSRSQSSTDGLKEASFYHQLDNGLVQCDLCPNRCVLADKQRGLCKARENIKGKLYSLVYGKPVTTNVDPIEKKPLFHFLPGAKAYSLATAGCNLNCQYCQNWDISQRQPEDIQTTPMTAEQVVQAALKAQAQVIAFTYNEPTVWYEYMLDISRIAKAKGLKTVMISSGYINEEPLKELLPYLDAVKIDFKSFNSEVYQTLIRGKIEPIMDNIKTVYQSGKWLEIVNLIVPGYTDDLEEIKNMCTWLKENTSPDVPVHFSRFYPMYKLVNLAPTNEDIIKQARQVCMEAGMKYVYTGNISDQEGSTTYCPDNSQPLIIRDGFFISQNLLDNQGKTDICPSAIPGVWQ